MADSEMSLRTLLVGIDAGCFNVLAPFFENGALPTLQDLFDSGASDTLASQIPPWTASAWPSIYTGVNPGKHGVFGFLTFDGYDWELINSTTVRELTLWEVLDSHDLRSVVVNVPVTHPPPTIDGAIVPGYIAPNQPQCHPDGILDEIKEVTDDYYIYPQDWKTSENTNNLLTELVNLTRMRGQAFVSLCDRFDPHFGFVQFQQTDTVLHEFPGDREKALAVYEEVDRQLDDILQYCQPDTVMVVSDHGMGAYEGRFRINDFLAEHGYVESVKGGEGMPTWAKIRDNGSRSNQGMLPRTMEHAAKFGITSQRVGHILERLGLLEPFVEIIPDDVIRAASEQVDFADSTAYMRSRVETGIRINLAGREPDGTVPPDQYESVRNELISLLESARTPKGEPVFEDVAPREEYFSGPYVDEAVDIVTVPDDFRFYLTTWLLGDEYKTPDGPAWDHKLDGIVAVAGENINEGATLSNAHIFDIAPTVLSSLGLPVSDRMDGSPLPVVETTEARSYELPTDEQVTSAHPDVEARLSKLGYLE